MYLGTSVHCRYAESVLCSRGGVRVVTSGLRYLISVAAPRHDGAALKRVLLSPAFGIGALLFGIELSFPRGVFLIRRVLLPTNLSARLLLCHPTSTGESRRASKNQHFLTTATTHDSPGPPVHNLCLSFVASAFFFS